MKLLLTLLSVSAAKKALSVIEKKVANKKSAAKKENDRDLVYDPALCVPWSTVDDGGRSGHIQKHDYYYDNTQCSWNLVKEMGTKSEILTGKLTNF
jgi:hypothetical protein